MVFEFFVSVSHFAVSIPAIVGIYLAATLFLVGVISMTIFFYRRKSTISSRHRKGGVFLTTNRSPIFEQQIPLQGLPFIMTRRNEKTIHLIKKSPTTTPPYFTTLKSTSPVMLPIEENSSSHGNNEDNNMTEVHGPLNLSYYGGILTSTNKTKDNISSSSLPVMTSSSIQQEGHLSPPVHTFGHKIESPPILKQMKENISHVNPKDIDISSRSSSLTTVTQHNLEGGGQNQLGILHIKLRYKEYKKALIVTVVKCEDLPVKDTTLMTCDPYIKLQLLPEKQKRVKTRVLRHTRHPSYDEDFTFYGIQPKQLQGISLHFVILSFDRYSRDDVIGEVFCPLSLLQLPLTDNQLIEISRDIQSRHLKIKNQERGEILLSLCWQPTSNRLTVVILKARNLPKMDVTGLADPYIKMYLLYNGQRIVKKKTHIKKRTLNPVFNESFIFDLPPGGNDEEEKQLNKINLLEKISFQLILLDWDRVTKNEVIGKIELGNGAITETAIHHWNEILNCPRRPIAEWHKLKV